ncbi:glycosyltransferase family 2 protein [Martelella alba]|uniref:Glycosyltransferase family 2 protein n=1 Tax=Martelella alba TaxID=2590451 RepID=A0A506TYG3_9HYPH|nr:glycosyltransferase family 2 protein [Martelella alba]TPW27112.1 glycosyltransferase family 2 protein [Martelella alba]
MTDMLSQIAVLLTCFNRREKTLSAMAALFRQKGLGELFNLQVFLVDDGSSDGTGDAVRAAYPDINVIEGTGELYWNGGMRLAFSHGVKKAPDYMLWLNDDTDLDVDAVMRLLITSRDLAAEGHSATMVMGATRDPISGEMTYGGYQRRPGAVMRLKSVPPLPDRPLSVATVAGNCVLVSQDAIRKVGNLERQFFHAWGDVDYGLRLRQMGGSVWLAPAYVASCAANPAAQKWQDDAGLSLKERFRNINSFRGLYAPDWRLFNRRHGGLLWPLSWCLPYAKLFVRHLQFRCRSLH